jgi:8-oxo-dGTP pyrophosphatase MutT (NUDIX family)
MTERVRFIAYLQNKLFVVKHKGKVEERESLEDALIREVFEELGISVSKKDIRMVFIHEFLYFEEIQREFFFEIPAHFFIREHKGEYFEKEIQESGFVSIHELEGKFRPSYLLSLLPCTHENILFLKDTKIV